MKKILSNLLLLVIYSFPFVFFAIYQDYIYDSMIGYAITLGAYCFLAFICKYTRRIPILILSNLLSFLTSFLLTLKLTTSEWNYYFKPFTPLVFLIFLSVILILVQLPIAIFVKQKKLLELISGLKQTFNDLFNTH